jgi:multicomponent K+:H+ antiporter subunit F
MIVHALNFAFVALALAIALTAWRLLRGPEATDRVLALDTLYINTVALVILLGLRLSSDLLFEAALVIAMLGFIATVALARFLARGDVIE